MEWNEMNEWERALQKSRRYQERMKKYRDKKNDELRNLSGLPEESSNKTSNHKKRENPKKNGKM